MELTEKQVFAVKVAIRTWLSVIFEDAVDLNDIVATLLDEVVADIEETADWEGYEEDEINMDDAKIALARAMKWAVDSTYEGL